MVDSSTFTGNIVTWAVGAPSIGVIIAYGISIIRRRASTDARESVENKSYGNMIETYKQERDELRIERTKLIERMSVIEAERNDSLSKVGKLTAEVEFLTTQVKELKVLVERLSDGLDASRAEMHGLAVKNAQLETRLAFSTTTTTSTESTTVVDTTSIEP